jgi:predicted Zn-dependent protease
MFKAEMKQSLALELGIPADVLKCGTTAAYDYLQAGLYDRAIEMARGLVAADTTNWYYRHLLANALYRKNDGKAALEVIDAGLKFAPNSAELSELRTMVAADLASGGRRSVPARATALARPAGGDDLMASILAQSFGGVAARA